MGLVGDLSYEWISTFFFAPKLSLRFHFAFHEQMPFSWGFFFLMLSYNEHEARLALMARFQALATYQGAHRWEAS